MTPFERAVAIPKTENDLIDLRNLAVQMGHTVADVQREIERANTMEMWMNDTYTVSVDRQEEIVMLSIRRNDREAAHDWRDFQEIKNQLVGPENEGIELYPAESRLVDTANQYFLWVFTDPTTRLPLGFEERKVSDVSTGGAKQRPFVTTP